MQTVTLGASHLEVTPIAYGTWQFGGDWGPVDEQTAVAAISGARSAGINFFDTVEPTPGRGRYGSVCVPSGALRVT